MSKFVIVLNNDVEMLNGEQYDTLEEAKSVATNILKQLHDDSSKNIDDFEDEVCGFLGEEDSIDDLTILEITPAVFPDFGYMIFDGLENYSMDDGNPDDEWPEATNKDQNELNELVSKWLTDKGYTPNWYNVVHSYLVEAQHDTRTD